MKHARFTEAHGPDSPRALGILTAWPLARNPADFSHARSGPGRPPYELAYNSVAVPAGTHVTPLSQRSERVGTVVRNGWSYGGPQLGDVAAEAGEEERFPQ